MTKKKVHKKRPGPKLPFGDRRRVQLAADLREKYPNLGPYTALKVAAVMHPDGLPKPLPKSLANVPIPPLETLAKADFRFPLAGKLSKESRNALMVEVNRLEKALVLKEKHQNWAIDNSTIVGSPSYIPPDGISPDFDDGYTKIG